MDTDTRHSIEGFCYGPCITIDLFASSLFLALHCAKSNVLPWPHVSTKYPTLLIVEFYNTRPSKNSAFPDKPNPNTISIILSVVPGFPRSCESRMVQLSDHSILFLFQFGIPDFRPKHHSFVNHHIMSCSVGRLKVIFESNTSHPPAVSDHALLLDHRPPQQEEPR